MIESHLVYLDQLARGVRETGDGTPLGPLSDGERIYAALAANRADLLPAGHSIVSAIDRLGPEETGQLIARWRYGGA